MTPYANRCIRTLVPRSPRDPPISPRAAARETPRAQGTSGRSPDLSMEPVSRWASWPVLIEVAPTSTGRLRKVASRYWWIRTSFSDWAERGLAGVLSGLRRTLLDQQRQEIEASLAKLYLQREVVEKEIIHGDLEKFLSGSMTFRAP